jgi:hypothetical protein
MYSDGSMIGSVKARAQQVHILLQHVRVIDEQVGRLLLAADCVEACGDHVLRAPALDEVVLHREHEEALRCLLVVLGEAQRRRELRDVALPVVEGELARLLEAEARAPHARRRRDVLAYNLRAAARILRKCNLVDDRILLEDGTALDAHGVATLRVCLNIRGTAVGAALLRHAEGCLLPSPFDALLSTRVN